MNYSYDPLGHGGGRFNHVEPQLFWLFPNRDGLKKRPRGNHNTIAPRLDLNLLAEVPQRPFSNPVTRGVLRKPDNIGTKQLQVEH